MSADELRIKAKELREDAKDLRYLAHKIMAASPHTAGEAIATALDGAHCIDLRADLLEREAEARS